MTTRFNDVHYAIRNMKTQFGTSEKHSDIHKQEQNLLVLLDRAMEGPFHNFEPEIFKAEMRKKFAQQYPE